ncbi:MAG: hypothetical protein Q8M08_05210 [Bacteroidales bacterium]|nr:hypothetical protein [Bacteroidales bacterium]
MMKILSIFFACLMLAGIVLQGQTVIPNAGFENWINFGSYSDPVGWDTPNQELNLIPFIGISVVTKSNDHHGAGSFSAKLETKHYTFPPIDVPGFITCGKLTINLTAGSFDLTGGVPVVDEPTHLKGYFKYFPKGGDSCVIGIGLTKTTGAIKDTIGLGAFSTKDTVAEWTPFSAWIDYISADTPDTMNIIAMSTAQEVMTIGTILYVDDLYLDYTVGYDKNDPSDGINIYNDRETKRLMIFLDFEQPEFIIVRLFNIMGQEVSSIQPAIVDSDRKVIAYAGLPPGIYILEILRENKKFSRKFFLNQ